MAAIALALGADGIGWLGDALERRPSVPTCAPAFLFDAACDERVLVARPTDDGGLLEFWLLIPSLASTASRRANSMPTSLSFS